MELNTGIAKIIDKYLPADGNGTERYKLRIGLITELMVFTSRQVFQAYKDGRKATIDDGKLRKEIRQEPL